MKPMIVYADENGLVKMSKEEFEKRMEEAYNRGWTDRSKHDQVSLTKLYTI